jgi:small subunit ribosomal protein S5
MAEFMQDSEALESNTIGVFRSAATVAGGRRFSFGSQVVVGDRNGRVGLGYAKANEVPPAIEKAQKNAKKNMQRVTLQGGTFPHTVTGRYGASIVKLLPASPGTGVVAGSTVRAVLELAGVTDALTKSYGSNNQKNLARATLDGLSQLRTREQIASLRGVEIDKTEVDERLERGAAFMPKKTAAPKPQPAQEEQGGRGGRGGRGGGRGGRGGGGGPQGGGGAGATAIKTDAPRPQPKAEAPPKPEGDAPADAPASEES